MTYKIFQFAYRQLAKIIKTKIHQQGLQRIILRSIMDLTWKPTISICRIVSKILWPVLVWGVVSNQSKNVHLIHPFGYHKNSNLALKELIFVPEWSFLWYLPFLTQPIGLTICLYKAMKNKQILQTPCRLIYKMEINFWAVFGSWGCREENS